MNTSQIAGLVLAGGRARRMGGVDKALLPFGGTTMLGAVIAALDLPVVAISANGDPTRFAAFGCPVLSDGAFQDQGPLAGLLVGLEWAAGLGMTAVLTAPCDTPCLPHGLARRLWPPPCGVISAGRRHHLVASWPVACAADLRAMLSSPGSRRVGDFADRIGMRHVEFPAEAADSFANVNSPDDLDRARKAMAER
ncbi:molybdenum cofactor guanylyltransferase MobA [Rhodopila globiformis]|uniref:Molybdenum cofactor guanylyltransferase n=1 Tax=Rhodopila globiformis TaxID=1071 RepID=A0A2S6NFA5_RHOGL|nr:molybdenum cofactor guanylyltransferase MobA [Rhodopila globiformis]PPQ33308.1 molybdenum cofactor guanylyltransferase [Rhodopila globiformis]